MTNPGRYQGAFENALDAFALHEIVTDDNGIAVDYIFLEVNPSFERMLGVSSEDVVGRRVTEVFPGVEQESWIEIYGRVVATGEPADFDQRSELLDRYFKVHAYRSDPGEFVTVFHDISAYVRAREALEHSEALRRSMIESSPDHIMRVDVDGTIQAINRTVEGLKPGDVIGSKIYDYLDERWHAVVTECFERVIRTGKPDRYEVEYDYEDGHVGYFESRVGPVVRDGEVVALTVAATDRTQQYELEEKLRQSQKMEAIGRMAGGVAHDFNNLLTGIKGFSHLALSRENLDATVGDDLAQISVLVDQAGDLTHQLLAFSRRQPVDVSVLSLNQVIDDTAEMLRRLLGENFSLDLITAPDSWNVRADRSQLQQIIINLTVNARDAMPSGGRIAIETRNRAAKQAGAAAASGDFVVLSVADDGPGIDSRTLPHIFEPFFTTKEAGRGTGLGLATVYGIVKQHDGHVVVRSEPGDGARFDVFLPAVSSPVDHPGDAGDPRTAHGGSETVLVVEDDESVREVTARILQSRGYEVMAASNPSEARECFASRPVNLLVTDVVMPGGDGPSLFRALSAIDADLKVIYISGYAEPAGIGDIAALGAPYLRKPFAPHELVRMVRECLDD